MLTTRLTIGFLRELRAKHRVDQAIFFIDAAPHLRTVLTRLDFDARVERFGQGNAVERVFREGKRHSSPWTTAFRNADHDSAESWLQAFVA